MTEILLGDQFFNAVILGIKTVTIRKGIRDYTLGPATLIFSFARVLIEIKALHHCKLMDVEQNEVLAAGYTTHSEMLTTLNAIYPGLQVDDAITLVHFNVIDPYKPEK